MKTKPSSRRQIEMWIPFEVRPKQGDRTYIAKGPRPFVRHYQPKAVTDNAKSLERLLAEHVPSTPFEGPLIMVVRFELPIPKSAPSRVHKVGFARKHTKPDTDNLLKQLCDVMQRMGFYKNDSQLSEITASRWVSKTPGTAITLEEVDEVPQ